MQLEWPRRARYLRNILKSSCILETLTVVGLFTRNTLNGPQQTVMPGESMLNWRRTLVRLIVLDQYTNLLLHSQPLIRQRFCGRYVLLIMHILWVCNCFVIIPKLTDQV